MFLLIKNLYKAYKLYKAKQAQAKLFKKILAEQAK